MPACQGQQATVPDADVDSAASFLGYLYIVSQYTVKLMTPCVWRIFCLRNSSSVPYFRQPPNFPTTARRNRNCAECGTTAFGRNRMSAESAHLSTFGAETETEIRSTSSNSSRVGPRFTRAIFTEQEQLRKCPIFFLYRMLNLCTTIMNWYITVMTRETL